MRICWSKYILGIVLAVLAGAPALTATPALADEPVAQLVSLRGDVSLRHGGDGDAEKVVAARPLSWRDEIETHAFGSATVKLPSGAILELGEETLLVVIRTKVNAYLARGTVQIKPDPTSNGKPVQVVQIQGAAGKALVQSHDALVSADNGDLRVTLGDGSATLIGKGGKVQVAGGQTAELHADGTPSQAVARQDAARPVAREVAAVPPPAVSAPPAAVTPPAVSAPPAAVTPPPPSATYAQPPATYAQPPTTYAQPAAPVIPPVASAGVALPPMVVTPGATPPATTPTQQPFAEFTTLRLLRDKGVITQAELDSAMRDMAETSGARAGDNITLVLGKWATTIYGFVQGDMMWNSTQSGNDYIANAAIARPSTYAGQNGRTVFSVRDSRFGIRVQVPKTKWVRLSATLETDFLGNSGTIAATGTLEAPATNYNYTESAFFSNPVLRIRHAYFKVETPIVDVLFGQTWDLFGWLPNFVPAIVQYPGVVADLYARTVQLRVSKTVKSDPVNFEFAVAAMRPPQRDSMTPEGQAGIRLVLNNWTAMHTTYMTSGGVTPASIGISADIRHYAVPNVPGAAGPPTSNVGLTSTAIAGSLFMPIIPGTKDNKDNSWSIIGEFVYGQSISDMYTGLTGGLSSSASIPAVTVGGTPTTFTSAIDAGLVAYDANHNPILPTWMNFLVGTEYYFPKTNGHLGLFANVSRSQLLSATGFVGATLPGATEASKVRDHEFMFEGGLFIDPVDALRIGIDYAQFRDTYTDAVTAVDHAVQASAFLFF